ncbi:MAG: hypothetical protein ACLQVD_10680 [Capsulimonadaceae bacterium]
MLSVKSTAIAAGAALALILCSCLYGPLRIIVGPELLAAAGDTAAGAGTIYQWRPAKDMPPGSAISRTAWAAAVDSPACYTSGRCTHLRALVAASPTDAAAYATLVRLESGDNHTGPPDTALLAQIDADAAAGEQSEPENAFFPTMRAAGLFEQHRDVDAAEALDRAASEHLWNEHIAEVTDSQLALADRGLGGASGIIHTELVASVLFPQYRHIRQMVQAAVDRAIALEQQHDTGDAIRLRVDAMRIASLMRTHATTVIEMLVADWCDNTAASRPNGAPAPPDSARRVEIPLNTRLGAFNAYLQQTGNGRLVPAVTAELTASFDDRYILRKSMRQDDGMGQVNLLSGCMVTGACLLANAFWLFALAGAAWWVGRASGRGARLRQISLCAGASASTAALLSCWGSPERAAISVVVFVAGLAIGGGYLFARRAGLSRAEMAASGFGFAVAAAAPVFVTLQANGLRELLHSNAGLIGSPETGPNAVAAVAAPLVVPVLCLAAVAVVRRLWLPARSMSASTLQVRAGLTCALVALCACLVCNTVAEVADNSLTRSAEVCLLNEPATIAARIGLPLPGPVDWSAAAGL